ncbi:MAG TPA: cation diffusion facilitator family transporter [Acidimicrobiales bacterium]|nr:cation diffusion facilitator family transporter [Acidimicrobiales bacterium]
MADVHRDNPHSHDVTADTDVRYVMVALGLILTFLVGEVVAAIIGRSLVLFADAGHMLTDVAALGMSAWAIRLAKRPAQGRWTFGLQRAEIVSAAVNGVTLVAIALLIGVEAIQRLISPEHVKGGVVLTVAIIGAVINVIVTWLLSKTNRSSLNLRGAYVHILTDLFAFIGTGIAGLVIILSGWERADAVASLVVVALMAKTSWGLLRDAGRILLQASPDTLDLNDVRAHLSRVQHVLDVHDLHAWSVTSGSLTLSAHVVVEGHCFDSGHAPQILDALQKCLAEHFDIEHATFQLEPAMHVDHEPGLHP